MMSFEAYLSTLRTANANEFNVWEASNVMFDGFWVNNVISLGYDLGIAPDVFAKCIAPDIYNKAKDFRKYGENVLDNVSLWPRYERYTDEVKQRVSEWMLRDAARLANAA